MRLQLFLSRSSGVDGDGTLVEGGFLVAKRDTLLWAHARRHRGPQARMVSFCGVGRPLYVKRVQRG